MSKAEILDGLLKLTPSEREEIRQRLAELDENSADAAAFSRGEELTNGMVEPKSHEEVFGNARAALQ